MPHSLKTFPDLVQEFAIPSKECFTYLRVKHISSSLLDPDMLSNRTVCPSGQTSYSYNVAVPFLFQMQKNLSRLEEKAERNLLLVNDEKDHLQEKVYKLKRENLLLDREEKLHDMLDKQAEALAPSIEVEETFKNNYKTFATALDCTRHQLPIKDIHVMGTRQRYLGIRNLHFFIILFICDCALPFLANLSWCLQDLKLRRISRDRSWGSVATEQPL
uniref:HAUS augmin like complex subunit 8 n=1 Tax=Leptobrachium leishanense TaxID=445787 RepID=A0A8C5QDE0_9ANUR